MLTAYRRLAPPPAVALALSTSLLAATAAIDTTSAQSAAGGSQPLPPVDVVQQPPTPSPTPAKPKPPVPTAAPAALPLAEPMAAVPGAAALGSYNPALDLPDLALPPGTTLTTAGPVDGYRALSATSSTRTATPIERIPQSIQVVPRSVIEDQQALSIDEAVRNVSGVQATNSLQTPAYDSTRIRGFAAEQWIDGIPVYYNVGNRDALANVERIEVLKGPSAILYGGGAGAPVGGAINIVSKLPTSRASGEFGFTFGSYGYLQPTFDINQPLSRDGTALFRITGEYTAADSFIDAIETERYALNPTLVLTDKVDTTFTIQGRFGRWEQPEYQGLPATGTVAGAAFIDRDLFIGPDNLPDSYSQVQGVTVTVDHRFNDWIDGSVKARVSRQKFAEFTQTIVGADSFQANAPFVAPSTWALSNVYLYQEQDEVAFNPNVRFKLDAGPARTLLLVGGDYTRLTDTGILTSDLLTGGAGLVDLSDPTFPTPFLVPPDSPFTTFQKPGNEYVTQGLYTQLQTTLMERLHLLAGLRLANIKIDYVDPVAFADFQTDTTKLLPRAGAVVDVVPGLSVFASYSQGLKANPYTFFVGEPEPEESEQKETGVKLNLGGALTGTLAVFEIDRSKVPVPVPGGFASAAIGEQRSRGFEADLLYQLGANWQVLANYAYVDAELVEAASGASAGSKLVGVPEHSGRVWLNYGFDADILPGWSVGAGVYAAAGSPVDLANRYVTEDYFTIDAKVAYDAKTFSAAVHVKNLTGEEYFVPYSYFNGRVAPGEERAVYGTVKYRY